MQFLKMISHTQREETAVDVADYGHSRQINGAQILSPVPRLSYQDSSLTLGILSIIDTNLGIIKSRNPQQNQ
ncbi:hypothetical protein Peur_019129 [Populus x canadensis]